MFFTSSFILQIVSILVLFFLKFRFLNLRGHLKALTIIAFDINVIAIDTFIIISILNIIAELTELHELRLISSFLFLLILKVDMKKVK